MADTILSFEGAVAVITGGASGIGLSIARELLARGAASVVLADLRLEAAQKSANELGAKAVAVALDVRDPAAFERVIAGTIARSGRLDYLFNNAGTGVFGSVEKHSLDDWKLVMGVNVDGVIHGIHAAYPAMIKQGFGHIVNTASIAGLVPTPLLASYGMSKWAVIGLTRAMRPEAAMRGVRVSALCPGVIRTPLLTGGATGRVLSKTKIEDERILKWWRRIGPITDADVFARGALNKVRRNREIIIVPGWIRPALWLMRAFPWLESLATARDFKATVREVPELLDNSR